jgi:hypothetical protein
VDNLLFDTAAKRKHDIDMFVNRMTDKQTKEKIGVYLASLSKK